MTAYAAFLRGVNLGKRTVRGPELIAAFAALGFADARPVIASGNVVFSAPDGKDLKNRLEKGLEESFSFPVGVVLRTVAELRAMVAADPFAALAPDAEAKRYVILLDQPHGRMLSPLDSVEGDFDILSATDFDIFAVAWKMPNGRYGEGLDTIEKRLPKKTIVTMRNWNTILKAIAAAPGE